MSGILGCIGSKSRDLSYTVASGGTVAPSGG